MTNSDAQPARSGGLATLIPGPTSVPGTALPEGLVLVTPSLLNAAAAVLDGHGDPHLTAPAATMATVLRNVAASRARSGA